MGTTLDETRAYILAHDGPEEFGKFFDFPGGDIINEKTGINPVWSTWIEQVAESRISEVSIPYFGPRYAWLRVDVDEWQQIRILSMFECDQTEEVLGFEVENLVHGGSIDMREETR
jgi:hypothetical protein